MAFYDYLSRKFDHHGRATRMEFFRTWLFCLIMFLAYLIPIILTTGLTAVGFGSDMGMGYGDEDLYDLFSLLEYMDSLGFWIFFFLWMIAWGVYSTALFVMQVMTTVRRIRDMGWTIWTIIIAGIPPINIIFLLILFFWPPKRDCAKVDIQ